ncbi:prenylated Rab acceptor 1 [Aspergillus terreus]|nr:prenylated Rab acceptor 1 [Aspergillus terreus]
MPRWGRPPGARLGRQTRRRMAPWMEEGDSRIEEIESEDEFWMREGRAIATRMDLEGRFGWPRRMLDYGEDFDDTESVDGTDYDLYEDADSTVAYAVQLAMKDKEDWLVEKALERIRRAQRLGQKNVRLSKRELEALERKRSQTNGVRSHPAASPRGSSMNTPRKPPFTNGEVNDGYMPRARASGYQTPPRSGSLRSPYATSSPRTPQQTPYSSPLARSPVSVKSPTRARPLPDEPHWVPPPYTMHSHMDPRGSPGHPSMAPYMTGYPSAAAYGERRPTSARHSMRSRPTPSASEDEEEESEGDDSGDEVQMVDVVERRVPTGTPSRKTPSRQSTHRGSRQRSNRPR